ncbi:uncharacterized protein LOC104892747 [Beta vulgaris subsp. vulgaris]|uniref:uncharacterized protein LOC104892747 n=1 Tax=Beta vulgaris subsp. vulgaris TaxID=3555 RepID=UPI00053F75EE|nr:uncharacterized protein LOC104892747 [Beta vulgaris subsp. vulgaris]
MVGIFGITNNLNVALQKRDQDIVNAMRMVNVTKINLQEMRDEGWDSHMEKVISFMAKYDIEVPSMEGKYVVPGRRLFRAKLIELAKFYPNEFSSSELIFFNHTLQNFIVAMRSDERFWNLKTLSELSMKLVETELSETHDRVYLLLELVLILPVATASVERVFSGMMQVKDKLRNSMGDQMLNDCLITYLENDLFFNVSMNDIINRYQNMKTRREQL